MQHFDFSTALFRRISASLLILLLVIPMTSRAQATDGPSPTVKTSKTRTAATHPEAVPPSAFNAHPRLAIILVIDQFREDYLERYRADFKGHGFKLFLDQGAYFPDCYYDYANTKTAPGHATIGTGAYSDGHGIANNSWWDLARNKERPITSVEDERYALVGIPPNTALPGSKPAPGASPRNLRASTVGDELRLATNGQARVFGISLKDRASILPAGSTANAAYWIDPQSGAFITSSYYTPQLPTWAAAFNASGRAAQANADAHQFANSQPGTAFLTAPTASAAFFDFVGSTPAANSYELDFARALIMGEKLGGEKLGGEKLVSEKLPADQLGQNPVTDLLTISLSANDLLGHAVGPNSPLERAMVDSLDTDLDSFFTWLDKNVDGGLGNVWIALTADHGIAPIPSEAAKLGINAATINTKKLVASLNDAMNLKFSPGEKVNYVLDRQSLPYLSLNQPNFDRAGINEQEAEQAILDALPSAVDSLSAPPDGGSNPPANPQSNSPSNAAPNAASNSPSEGANPPPSQPKVVTPSQARLPPTPYLVRAYARQQLAAGTYPGGEFGQLLAHSYSPNGGWYVMAIFGDYQMDASAGTTHFSPYSYDRHVPLGFYGAPFAPGVYHGRVGPVDLAATWASLLGINQPSSSIGHILTQALKPAAAVAYPKPAPVRAHSTRATRGKAAEAEPPPTPASQPSVSPTSPQPPTPAPQSVPER